MRRVIGDASIFNFVPGGRRATKRQRALTSKDSYRRTRDGKFELSAPAGKVAEILVHALYRVRYTGMCPFRAIRCEAPEHLGMRERTYGWNLEMQMRAARANLRILEIRVSHRRRAGGRSKVSGSVGGTCLAAARIAFTLTRIALERR